MKNLKYITIILLVIFQLLMVSSFSIISNAAFVAGAGGGGDSSAYELNPDDYHPENTTRAVGNTDKISKIGNAIIGLIRTVGSLASVAVIIILGIKYMAGSIEEKAKYKETMVPYVIGAALTFGIINILSMIISIAGVFE